MSEEHSVNFVLYRYDVSVPAAAIFVVLFAITTGYHFVQLSQTRRWNMTPLVLGGLMQIGGYAARIKSHSDPYLLGAYITQTLLLLIAPVLFAATIYMTLSGIIVAALATNLAKKGSGNADPFNDNTSDNGSAQPSAADVAAAQSATIMKIPVAWITRIFVTADIVSLMTQGGGGGIMAGGDVSKMDTGEAIILFGLWVQIIAFCFFLAVAIVFHLRQHAVERSSSSAGGAKPGWRKMLYVLYAVSALMLVRNLFRVVEYAQGNDGYLMSTEAWLYVFDATLMFILMLLFNVAHPGKVLAIERQAGGKKEIDELEMLP